MFKLCYIKDKPDVKFILFHDSDFTVSDFNMEVEKELNLNNNKFDDDVANHYTMLSYSDLVLKTISPKTRTDTDKLDSIGIRNLADIDCEHSLIQLKKSRLSRSERECVKRRYQDIIEE